MAFFTIAFIWFYFLFLAGGILFVLLLFLVYRLAGGKRSFRAWFKALEF